MSPFKRGDIVRQQVCAGRWDFFHVEHVHANGALDVVDDRTGGACGLSSRNSKLELATLAELVERREEIARQAARR